MIRSCPKKVLVWREGAFWYRVGSTARPTNVDANRYEDNTIIINCHMSDKGALVGHEVYLKHPPRAQPTTDEYFIFLPYGPVRNDYEPSLSNPYADHFFRVFAIDTGIHGICNYMLVVRNGEIGVQIPFPYVEQ